MRWGALIQVDRPCERQLLWDTMAQAEPRSKAIEIRFVVTAADLSGDSELQPAKLDGLLSESGVMRSIARPSDDKGAEEGIAAAPGGAHELEEIEIQRQLLL